MLFHPDNVDRTVDLLIGHQQEGHPGGQHGRARERLADAETKLKRLRTVIEAGAEPEALIDSINEAQADKAAAKADLASVKAPTTLTRAEVYAMIDSLGDVGAMLADAKPAGLARLYQRLNLMLRYEPKELAIYAMTSPGVDTACVRGGT